MLLTSFFSDFHRLELKEFEEQDGDEEEAYDDEPEFMTAQRFRHIFYQGTGVEFCVVKDYPRRTREVRWACEAIASVANRWNPNGPAGTSTNTYRKWEKAIHPSDVAFVIWALHTHREIWATGKNGREKRVSGKLSSEDKTVFYQELKRATDHMDPEKNSEWLPFLEWFEEQNQPSSLLVAAAHVESKAPRVRGEEEMALACDQSYMMDL